METYKRAYRKFGNQSLFDSEERTSMLSALGNPLERLTETVDFEMFLETLEAGLYRERLTKAGRSCMSTEHPDQSGLQRVPI